MWREKGCFCRLLYGAFSGGYYEVWAEREAGEKLEWMEKSDIGEMKWKWEKSAVYDYFSLQNYGKIAKKRLAFDDVWCLVGC